MSGLISNPPYNIKWEPYEDKRFIPELAPESNANYAFIQTALAEIDHQAVFLLPMGVLSSHNKKEKEIRKWLLKEGYIQGVIALPERMFESTPISVCLLVLNKKKKTTDVMMIDARKMADKEERYQKGQYGSRAHTNRTYEKKVNVLSDKTIETLVQCINTGTCIKISRLVSLEMIEKEDWQLAPSRYIAYENKNDSCRSFEDIVRDINRIAKLRNAVKLVVNETLAKKLKLDITSEDLKKSKELVNDLNPTVRDLVDGSIISPDYLQLTKNKNQLEFKQNDKEIQSEMMTILFNMWKQHIVFLNNMENQYLKELRDALLPKLMSGEISLQQGQHKQGNLQQS